VFLTSLGLDVYLFNKNGYLVKKNKSELRKALKNLDSVDPALRNVAGDLADMLNNKFAGLEPWKGPEIVKDDAFMLGKHLVEILKTLDWNSLERAPLDAVFKEISKRGIRINWGAVSCDADGVTALNGLLTRAMNGELVDHSDLVQVGIDMIKKNHPNKAKRIVAALEFWQQFKLAPDSDAAIKAWCKKRGVNVDAPDFDPSHPKYVEAAKRIFRDSLMLVNFMTKLAFSRIPESYSVFFKHRDALAGSLDAVEAVQRCTTQAEAEAAIKTLEADAKTRPDDTRKHMEDTLDALKKALADGDVAGAKQKAKDMHEELTLENRGAESAVRTRLIAMLVGFEHIGQHLPASSRRPAPNTLQRALLEGLRDSGATPDDVRAAFRIIIEKNPKADAAAMNVEGVIKAVFTKPAADTPAAPGDQTDARSLRRAWPALPAQAPLFVPLRKAA